MEFLRLLVLAIASLVWIGAMASGLVGFYFFICMFGERRPMSLPRELLTGGVWYLIDENLTHQATLITFGLGLAFIASLLVVHPGNVREFIRPAASNTLP